MLKNFVREAMAVVAGTGTALWWAAFSQIVAPTSPLGAVLLTIGTFTIGTYLFVAGYTQMGHLFDAFDNLIRGWRS